MKKYWFIALILFCFSALGSSDFDELGKFFSTLNSSKFSGSSLKIVQKRWLPKKFISEGSIGLSPVLKGFNYMNSYSTDIAYRFFLNDHWSIHLKYSRHSNPITLDGKNEVEQMGRIPLELKYPQKQSYLGGVDWYPFYGKAVLYNYLVRFDLYLSLSGGTVELLNWNKTIPMGSLSLGWVHWWYKWLNTRLEVQGFYYKYNVSDGRDTKEINEYFYKAYISAGVLF